MQSIDLLKRLALLDRDRIERVLEDMLALRASNDFDRMMSFTTPNVVMEVIGDPRSLPFAGRFEGQTAVIAAHYRMHVDVELFGQDLLDKIVDHERAMLRRKVRVRHRGGGGVFEHEIWDVMRFEDGLISHIAKFIDADAYRRMQGL